VSVRAELVPPPNADRPNDGQVKFGVDVGPMGCMGFEAMDRPVSNYGHSEAVDSVGGGGGGGGDAPYVQRLKSNRILRVLERTLLIGGAIDAEALCVTGGSWVWRLHVDVGLLDDGGNSVGACVLAAVAALRHYRLPEVSVVNPPDGGGRNCVSIIHSDDREPSPLPLHHTPLTATFALFANETGASFSALLDPSDREELACDGLLTWAYNRHGEMCCLDFPGGCEVRPRRLLSIVTMGRDRCMESCEMLETVLAEAEGRVQAEMPGRTAAATTTTTGHTHNNQLKAAAEPNDDDDDDDGVDDNKQRCRQR
jgi:exosome complex component RRP45